MTVWVLTSQHADVAMAMQEATRDAARSFGLAVDVSRWPPEVNGAVRAIALTVVDLTAVDVSILTVDGRRTSRIPDLDALVRTGVALGALGSDGVLAVRDVSRGGALRLPLLDVVDVDMEAGRSTVVDGLRAAVSRKLARIASPRAGVVNERTSPASAQGANT